MWSAAEKPSQRYPLTDMRSIWRRCVLEAISPGLRRGELLSLRWSDVDMDSKLLTVRAEQAKSGKQRHLPLNTEAGVGIIA